MRLIPLLALTLGCPHHAAVEGLDDPPPDLPPLVSLDNACRPGDCIGWDWEIEQSGPTGLGVQVLDWGEPSDWASVRLRALPSVLTADEAIAWLESGVGVQEDGLLWKQVQLSRELDDGFELYGQLGDPDHDYAMVFGYGRPIAFRVIDGVQIVCSGEHYRSENSEGDCRQFCASGLAGGTQAPDHGIAAHSWMATASGWELAPRDALAAHAFYAWGEAEGWERTTIQLRDPHEPVEAEHWLAGLLEPGFLNSGFQWSEARLVAELEGGFVIEGSQHLSGSPGSSVETAFVVIRDVGGHPVLCHPITLETPDHFGLAYEFCLEGFEAVPR